MSGKNAGSADAEDGHVGVPPGAAETGERNHRHVTQDRLAAVRQRGMGWQHRFEATLIGKMWKRLSELGFIDSSIQFSATFILSFIPFLLIISALVGRDLPHALVTRSGFTPQAAHDVTSLFAHSPTSITLFTIVGVILTVAGADSMAKILQSWYAKVFAQKLVGWQKPARRAHWLFGAGGYLMVQFFIGRRIVPVGGVLPGAIIQFLVSVVFWWWSIHTLLAGTIRWRRLFVAGLATAICYALVGIYVRLWASWTIVTNESSYGPIGAVMTIIATLVALGIAIHLGAVIGADFGEGRYSASTVTSEV
jgi:membrane protein